MRSSLEDSPMTLVLHYVTLGTILSEQESLANAKVSARQPSSIDVIRTSLKGTFSAQQFRRWQCGSVSVRLAVVASQKCEVAQNSKKVWTYVIAVQGHPRSLIKLIYRNNYGNWATLCWKLHDPNLQGPGWRHFRRQAVPGFCCGCRESAVAINA